MPHSCSRRVRGVKASALGDQQQALIKAQIALINQQARQLDEMGEVMRAQGLELARQGSQLRHITEQAASGFSAEQLTMLLPHLRRNFLPNDDSIMQKQLQATWQAAAGPALTHRDLLASGFRVFSQNDEDGMLLRIFSQIGQTNQYVIEIGSNCSDSDLGIPENLSANLIVNHGWHGAIFEMDQTECDRTRYFFARDFATKHFHVTVNGQYTYLSPLIIQGAISPGNIDQKLLEACDEPEPDLMIIDIDGGDYAVIDAMRAISPRVLVVEFEKRFRDRHRVVQFDTSHFSKRWPQSGAASLPAWQQLLTTRGYTLSAIASTGYNAFFIRNDVADGKFVPLDVREAFDSHPIFSKVAEEVWLMPDETWQPV
jgi:hypothetical protein